MYSLHTICITLALAIFLPHSSSTSWDNVIPMSFGNANFVNIRIELPTLPPRFLPAPPPQLDDADATSNSDDAAFDPRTSVSDSVFGIRTVVLRPPSAQDGNNGEEGGGDEEEEEEPVLPGYLEGELPFRKVLAVYSTEYIFQREGITCYLLDPIIEGSSRPLVLGVDNAALMATRAYNPLIGRVYRPWFKWARGIRCEGVAAT